MAQPLDKEKWNKGTIRSIFRFCDPRPVGQEIAKGQTFTFQVGFEPMEAVNLFSRTRENLDCKRLFPVYCNGEFVGILDPGKYVRQYMAENHDENGYSLTVMCKGIRYVNTNEPNFSILEIAITEGQTEIVASQENPHEFMINELEETLAADAQKMEERKGFFKKLFGK